MNIVITLSLDEWQRLMDAVTFAESWSEDWPPEEWDEDDTRNYRVALAKMRGWTEAKP